MDLSSKTLEELQELQHEVQNERAEFLEGNRQRGAEIQAAIDNHLALQRLGDMTEAEANQMLEALKVYTPTEETTDTLEGGEVDG